MSSGSLRLYITLEDAEHFRLPSLSITLCGTSPSTASAMSEGRFGWGNPLHSPSFGEVPQGPSYTSRLKLCCLANTLTRGRFPAGPGSPTATTAPLPSLTLKHIP